MFFEGDRSALERLKKNIAALKVEDEASVVGGDLFRHFEKAAIPQEKATVIFLDPPYRFLNEKAEVLRGLAGRLAGHLDEEGILVFRHDAKDGLKLPGLVEVDVRTYGGMTVEILGTGS